MKIGFASRDWSSTAEDAEGKRVWGGSGWYRCGLPAKYLRAQGLDVVEGTLTFSNESPRLDRAISSPPVDTDR